MLGNIWNIAKDNCWATNLLTNAGLVAVTHYGHSGDKDTPPPRPMIGNEYGFSPLSPAALVSNLDFSTPERTIEHPAHTNRLLSHINVVRTQPPASVIPLTCGFWSLSSEHAPENIRSWNNPIVE